MPRLSLGPARGRISKWPLAFGLALAIVIAPERSTEAKLRRPEAPSSASAATGTTPNFPLAGFPRDSPTDPRLDDGPGPRILILSSYERYTASARGQEDGIRSAIEAAYPHAIIRADYLISADAGHRFTSDEVKQSLADLLRSKYAGTYQLKPPDLIVTIDTLAFDLITGAASDVFPGVPLVFSGVFWPTERILSRRTDTTGVVERADATGTINLMLRQRPGTRKVLLVGSDSDFSDRLLAEITPQLERFSGRLEFVLSPSRTVKELRAEFAGLTPEWAILYLTFNASEFSGESPDSTPERDLIWPVPAYTFYGAHIGRSIVGGSVVHSLTQGRCAGELAVRVLMGERPGSIPISESGALATIIDYPVLQRWGISESTLPPGAIVLRRPRPWVERYSQWLWWGTALGLLQTAFVGMLLAGRRRLRRTESELAEIAIDNAASREALARDQRIFLQGPAVSWRWRNTPGWPVEYVSGNIALLGYAPEDFTSGRILFADTMHPEDLVRISAEVAEHIAAGVQICSLEYRFRAADGRWLWLIEHSAIERDEAGNAHHFTGYTIDDTALREADRLAQEGRERYRQIVETAQEGVWVVDAEWKTTLVNLSMADMLGRTRQEMLGRPIFDFMDESARPEARSNLQRREDGIGERHDFRFKHRSGQNVWTLISTNELRNERAEFVGALAMVTDITDRKSAEEALATSAERYRLILEAAGAGIFDWDLVTGEVYVSSDMLELMGLIGVHPKDILESWRRLLHPEDRPGVERMLEGSISRGAVYDTEYRLFVSGGHYLWIRARGNTIRDEAGHPLRMVGSLQNVDDTKRADLALRENEQRLSLLVQRTPLAVIHWDTEFRITQWNPAAEAIFGWSAAEAIGQDGCLIVPERDRPYVEKIIEDLLAKRGGERGTNQNLTKDGRTVFCEWYNTALIGPEGNVFGIASIGEDVTLERGAHRHQQLIMAELDHRVKNTLAAVISLAEQTGRSSTTYKDFLASLLGRIRALERLHSALANQRWQGADLFDLVRATIEAFGHHASNLSSIEGPRVTLPPRTAQAVAMALNELATNAAKYGALATPDGGIAVVWQLVGTLPAPTLILTWTEHGGPPVAPPTMRGFGTELIEGSLAHELGGTADIEFHPQGVRARFVVPLTPDPVPAPDPALFPYPNPPSRSASEPIADNPTPFPAGAAGLRS